MSKLIKKSHTVSIWLYHFVCPVQHHRAVFDSRVDKVLKEVCGEIAKRYPIEFIEIGTDNNHVHVLIQVAPTYRPPRIIQMVKSLTTIALVLTVWFTCSE